jgi:hypothetical protein
MAISTKGAKNNEAPLYQIQEVGPEGQWEFIKKGEYYQIRNKDSKQYIANFKQMGHAAVMKQTNGPGEGALWKGQKLNNGFYQFQNKLSQLYLANGAVTKEGTPIYQVKNPGKGSYWKLIPVQTEITQTDIDAPGGLDIEAQKFYEIRNYTTDMAISTKGAKNNEAKLYQIQKVGPEGQWEFIKMGAFYRIRNKDSRQYIANFKQMSHAAEMKQTNGPGEGALWKAIKSKDGYYQFQNKSSQLFLANGAVTQEGTPIYQVENPGDGSYWKLISAGEASSERTAQVLSIDACKKIARKKLAEMRDRDMGWTENSMITAHFPIYIPGIETPSYYEFKVKDGARNAGYILVNTNQSDIQVPEFSGQGLTLTEKYQKQIGKGDYRVYRYNWMSSAVKSPKNDQRFLASLGLFKSDGQITQYSIQDYQEAQKQSTSLSGAKQYQNLQTLHGSVKEKVEVNKVLPIHKAENLRQYYQKQMQLKEKDASGKIRPPSNDHRNDLYPSIPGGPSDEQSYVRRVSMEKLSLEGENDTPGEDDAWLCHYTYYDHPDDIWHTPAWYGGRKREVPATTFSGTTMAPVGCGATAWAIVYGYWKNFKGKDGLFGGASIPWNRVPTALEDAQWRIAELVNMDHQPDYGRSWSWDMPGGINYAIESGYPEASVWTGNDWNDIFEEIRNDRPVILLIINGLEHAPGFVIGDHYVVVERAYKNTRGEISFWVNKGWGQSNGHMWISVGAPIPVGINYFCIEMEDESDPPGPFTIDASPVSGEHTICGGRVSLSLDSMECDWNEGKLTVFNGDYVYEDFFDLRENEEVTVNLPPNASGWGRTVRLEASSGDLVAERRLYTDFRAPTFSGINVEPSASRRGAVFSPVDFFDDGNWDDRQYQITIELDGRPQTASGTSITIEDLSVGNHWVSMQIRDRCYRQSETVSREFEWVNDLSGPRLRFISPEEHANYFRGNEMNISIEASDPESGIMSMDVYIDEIPTTEFVDPNPLIQHFPGVIGKDRPEIKSIKVNANWSFGEHKIIVVAQDMRGNKTTIERAFIIQLRRAIKQD